MGVEKNAPCLQTIRLQAENYAIVGMPKVEEHVSSSNAIQQSESSIRLVIEPKKSNTKCHEIDCFDRYRI